MRLRDGKYIFDCVDAVVVFDDIEKFQYTYHGKMISYELLPWSREVLQILLFQEVQLIANSSERLE